MFFLFVIFNFFTFAWSYQSDVCNQVHKFYGKYCGCAAPPSDIPCVDHSCESEGWCGYVNDNMFTVGCATHKFSCKDVRILYKKLCGCSYREIPASCVKGCHQCVTTFNNTDVINVCVPDACSENPCGDNGICVGSTESAYQCICKPGHCGKRCHMNDDSHGNMCSLFPELKKLFKKELDKCEDDEDDEDDCSGAEYLSTDMTVDILENYTSTAPMKDALFTELKVLFK